MCYYSNLCCCGPSLPHLVVFMSYSSLIPKLFGPNKGQLWDIGNDLTLIHFLIIGPSVDLVSVSRFLIVDWVIPVFFKSTILSFSWSNRSVRNRILACLWKLNTFFLHHIEKKQSWKKMIVFFLILFLNILSVPLYQWWRWQSSVTLGHCQWKPHVAVVQEYTVKP